MRPRNELFFIFLGKKIVKENFILIEGGNKLLFIIWCGEVFGLGLGVVGENDCFSLRSVRWQKVVGDGESGYCGPEMK